MTRGKKTPVVLNPTTPVLENITLKWKNYVLTNPITYIKNRKK